MMEIIIYCGGPSGPPHISYSLILPIEVNFFLLCLRGFIKVGGIAYYINEPILGMVQNSNGGASL